MMGVMNPFDQPPTEPPVSFHPPSDPGRGGVEGPRRGRMALAALAAAGLVGGGIVVAGQFASADEPSLGTAAVLDEPVDEPAEEPVEEPADDQGGDAPMIDGEIVIDDGDGDPLVLDLGRIGECVGPILGGEGSGALPFDDEFQQRMEEFLDDLPWDELGDGLPHDLLDDGVRIFGSGGSTITVVGPDGVEVIDLGDGDATVTIEQSDGGLTIETEGDVTVNELPDLGEMLPEMFPDPGEMDSDRPELGEMSELFPFDLDEIESCLDDLD